MNHYQLYNRENEPEEKETISAGGLLICLVAAIGTASFLLWGVYSLVAA